MTRHLTPGRWSIIVCTLCTHCFSPTGKGPPAETTSSAEETAGSAEGSTTSDTGSPSTSAASASSTSTASTPATTSSGTTTGHACGDGVVDEGEECDDIGTDPDDGCSPDCMKEFRRVFITEAKFSGNLGGLAGADESCQSAAENAELPGIYKAWLSATDYSPATDFHQSAAPYVLVDGTPIAINWQDLVTDNLAAPIFLTEHGDPPPPPDTHPCMPVESVIVWTNTLAAGGIAYADKSCADWTDATQGEGHVGRADSLQSSWTQNCLVPCTTMAPLYCFEQ